MKFSSAAYIIMSVFLCGMLAQIVFLFAGYTKNLYPMSDLNDTILQTLKIYSANLAMVFAGSLFARITNQPLHVDKGTFVVALSLSGCWNLMLVISLYILLFVKLPGQDATIETILDHQQSLATNSLFIVTGVLSYFFLSKKKKHD
jgi:hypothetical protein